MPSHRRPKLVDATGKFLLPVLIDNAEQLPYDFAGLRCDASDGGGELLIPTQVANLEWGDYSLLGMEKECAVERKSHEDAVRTISQGRERFKRELAALSSGYKFAAVVVETDLLTLATVKPPFSEADPRNTYRTVMSWTVRYRVPWLFCGGRRLAEITTFRLLEKYAQQRYGKEG